MASSPLTNIIARGKRKNNKRGAATSQGSKNELFIGYKDGFHLKVPVPRLPRILGSLKTLNATNAVYPTCLPLDFAIAPINYNIASGSFANATQLKLDTLLNANTVNALGIMFSEYAIVGLRLEISLSTITNAGGFMIFAIDEKDTAAPTSNIVSKPHIELMAAPTVNGKNSVYINWKANDFLDLTWLATNNYQTSCTFKMYGDGTVTGTSGGLTAKLHVTGSVALCLRGLK